jgi:hypothetical protein
MQVANSVGCGGQQAASDSASDSFAICVKIATTCRNRFTQDTSWSYTSNAFVPCDLVSNDNPPQCAARGASFLVECLLVDGRVYAQAHGQHCNASTRQEVFDTVSVCKIVDFINDIALILQYFIVLLDVLCNFRDG